MVIVQALVGPPPPALQPRRPSTIALQPGRTGSSGSLLAGYKIGDDTSSTDQSCVRYVMKLGHGKLFCTYHGGDDSIKKN